MDKSRSEAIASPGENEYRIVPNKAKSLDIQDAITNIYLPYNEEDVEYKIIEKLVDGSHPHIAHIFALKKQDMSDFSLFHQHPLPLSMLGATMTKSGKRIQSPLSQIGH